MTKLESLHPMEEGSLFMDGLYGFINAIMVIPVSISFCTIIFRHTEFNAFLPFLVKLVLFSSAIHQICFTVFSSLPFAVGQVQDAGLIFLCTMANSVANGMANSDKEAIVPTTLFVLSICTALLGVMLIIVAKLKLASIVQYLPMPVVGGYLAFIGFFCGLAGLSMMAGVQVTNIEHFYLLCNLKSFILFLPGFVIGIGIYMALITFRSPFVLPVSLLLILVGFYSAMWVTGASFEDAREYGWISPLIEVGKFQINNINNFI
jgi:SulP family sulfate permease